MVRYSRRLRSSGRAEKPVRLRTWWAEVWLQVMMTTKERSRPPVASSHQILP